MIGPLHYNHSIVCHDIYHPLYDCISKEKKSLLGSQARWLIYTNPVLYRAKVAKWLYKEKFWKKGFDREFSFCRIRKYNSWHEGFREIFNPDKVEQ